MKKLVFILVILCNIVSAQSLEKRWNYMVKKSNSYKSHKVIKEDEINGMWEVIQDSLVMNRIKFQQEQRKVRDQKTEISSLKKQMEDLKQELSKETEEKNDVIASGKAAGKYISSLWIGIGVVVLICIILFILYKRSNNISEQKKKDYDQLSKSFEEYKTNKIEVERKLKREIQTYVNKLEDLKSGQI